MLEEVQEDQSGWDDAPRYKLVGDKIRGKRQPGHTGHLRP